MGKCLTKEETASSNLPRRSRSAVKSRIKPTLRVMPLCLWFALWSIGPHLEMWTQAEGARVSQHQINPADTLRIKYSNQSFVYLNIGESYIFKLNGGSEKLIRLLSVAEYRDSVINLIRRADILVEINGKAVDLECSPYTMPTAVEGLRIQVDITSGWLDLPKRVQLSVWDASEPIVDTRLFQFPLPGYRLFSQDTQSYNEPVHLGRSDGDPDGQRFYHNYGFDLAGFEGRDRVVSCVDGIVLFVNPDKGEVGIEDNQGFIFEYAHLAQIVSQIKKGSPVKRGQIVGLLGKKGPSGNFSHLHVGTYLARADLEAPRMNRNLNLYPWMVEANHMETGAKLFAVARPHQTVRTGESVKFDGRRSMAFGAEIISYRWEFHDGTAVRAPEAVKVYDKPGLYIAALWVEDERGVKDVDFCKVKVFSREKPEDRIPTLFVSHTPSSDLRVDQPVYFRGWVQGDSADTLSIDFGYGKGPGEYSPYSEITHRFKVPGIHIVTVCTSAAGLSLEQKIKLVVLPLAGSNKNSGIRKEE